MKTKFFFLSAMLASIAASAAVKVTPLNANYSTRQVTFKVEWQNASIPANNRVWVWIDFCPIAGTIPANSFSTATISNPAIIAGNGTIEDKTARGFFIEYAHATNTGTTITATLSNASGKFNWCAYVSDYPPNATMNNGTYTLKGSQPFVVNNATLGAGVSSFSGTCITSLTDATGCPGIINHPFSAGAINNGSSMVLVNAIPSAITSNTAASSGGGITYRWVRSGTSSTTYTVNNAGHSFTAAEVNTAGTWTYYREVRDNTCATTTWNRSSGSYVLTVINCPYQGSDLYIDATHLCQQRASGAQNWEAWIKDARDSKLYRIILMPDNKWWLAQNVKYAGVGSAITGCTEDECGRQYTWEQVYASYAGGSSGSSGNVQGICPSGWLLPVTYNYTTLTNLIGDETTICQRLRAQTSPCTPRIDYYGWASVRSTCNGEDLNAGDAWYANDTNREDGLIIDLAHNGSGLQCNKIYQHLVQAAHRASVRCFRQL